MGEELDGLNLEDDLDLHLPNEIETKNEEENDFSQLENFNISMTHNLYDSQLDRDKKKKEKEAINEVTSVHSTITQENQFNSTLKKYHEEHRDPSTIPLPSSCSTRLLFSTVGIPFFD